MIRNCLSLFKHYQLELLLFIALGFGGWNLLEARRWRLEVVSRPLNGIEFGKFLKGKVLKENSIGGASRPILTKTNNRSLVYALSPVDCGQALFELRSLLPMIRGLNLEVSIILIGASKTESIQLYEEFAPNVPSGLNLGFFHCEACSKSELGLKSTPYRILADLSRTVILDEGVVRFQEDSIQALSGILASKARTVIP